MAYLHLNGLSGLGDALVDRAMSYGWKPGYGSGGGTLNQQAMAFLQAMFGPSMMPAAPAPAPAPVYQAPAPAPVYQAPAPAPVYQAPAPAPVYQAPAPAPVSAPAVFVAAPAEAPAAAKKAESVVYVNGVDYSQGTLVGSGQDSQSGGVTAPNSSSSSGLLIALAIAAAFFAGS